MAHDLQKLAKESDLVEMVVRGNKSEFVNEFNRRLTHALSAKAPKVVEFLEVVLNQREVRQALPASTVSVFRNLLSHAESHLLFV
tara:strand:+ start:52 stop:306 length:255 start_codon:yes stop_codon:yes gene_type:complete